jgi:hypothetical protein
MNLTGQPIYQKGRKPAKVPAIRNDARDMECTLRIPGICRRDPAHTVGNHMRLFGIAGGAQKPDDIFILDACDSCHAVFDSRDKWAEAALGWDDVLRALMLTLRNRRAAGLIKLKGEA